ncbi:CSEP0070 putative effector protein [Blumeria hordei DH14]|uniref:CSEP0070 putative effector protein n=1 Tax=Blumeria graminis f. sp. hordei (strain DH14) TaxID=546991 RepID=N1J8G2_BLUG1|nr:CSEP0070 putative effector protein [Blumeria hordei DH14]
MRTSTLLRCLFTWLVTAITTVQCQNDYHCSNNIVVKGDVIQRALNDISTDSTSTLYAAGTLYVNDVFVNRWWKEMIVPESYYVGGTDTSYRLIYDDNKFVRSIQLVYHFRLGIRISQCTEVIEE